jgi:hypothetical protein
MIVINPKAENAISGVIIRRDGAAYLVQSAAGRIVSATSDGRWNIGETVTVFAGQIIGHSGRQTSATVYEV